MSYEDSPSSVMYAEFKSLGVSNRDVAAILLDTGRAFGEGTVRDRIDSRTRLSRDIVHVAPGALSSALFRDFGQGANVLYARVASRLSANDKEAALAIAQRFSGSAASAMQDALRAYGADDKVYRNALVHIANARIDRESDRALLYLLLFVVAGSTGDAHEGAQAVQHFISHAVGSTFKTSVADVEAQAPEAGVGDSGAGGIGLARIVGGKLKGADAFYRVSPTGQGSEIGSFASGDGAITDVDEDVSRRHARVYCEGGRWYIVGLGSTNGTSIISGEDKRERVVEPSRRERPRDWRPEPVEILPTDVICLGASTRFMVMPLLGE